MSTTQRLVSLSKLLLVRRQALNDAMKALSQARSQYNHAKEKQHQLTHYRKDYLGQLEVLGHQGCQVERLRSRIDFIAQLDDILQQITHELDKLGKIKVNCETKFQRAKAQHEAVERLIAKITKKQAYLMNRAEQKENDEHAQKQWHNTLATNRRTK